MSLFNVNSEGGSSLRRILERKRKFHQEAVSHFEKEEGVMQEGGGRHSEMMEVRKLSLWSPKHLKRSASGAKYVDPVSKRVVMNVNEVELRKRATVVEG